MALILVLFLGPGAESGRPQAMAGPKLSLRSITQGDTGWLIAEQEWLEKGLAKARSLDDEWSVAVAHDLGLVYAWFGDLSRGEPLVREALAICDKIRSKELAIQCLSTLSWIELSRGDYLAVQLTHEQARKLVEEGGWAGTEVEAQLMEDRAQLQAELGDLKEAERLYLAALSIRGK